MNLFIPDRRSNLTLINKKKNYSSNFFCNSGGPQFENKKEKIDKYLDLARKLKNKQTVEHEDDSDTNYSL